MVPYGPTLHEFAPSAEIITFGASEDRSPPHTAGNVTAAVGGDAGVSADLKARCQGSFDQAAPDTIKCYPPVPAGLEALVGATLGRINAAS